MSQTTKVIRVVVDTSGAPGLRDIARQMGELNRSVANAGKGFQAARSAVVGYFAAMRVGEVVNLADEMQLLFDRITMLSGSKEEATKALEGLMGAADRTKSSLSTLTAVYARMAATTKETGINTNALVRMTELLQTTFRLSGSSMQEAYGASVQLSQGFASGELRGQELRSVMEQNVALGQIMAETFKVGRGEIYKWAQTGQLTADKVMKALFDSGEMLDKKSSELGQTFGQTLTLAMNKVRYAIFKLNQEWGLNSKFAAGMEWVVRKSDALIVAFGAISLIALPAIAKAAAAAGTAIFAAFGPVGLLLAGTSAAFVYLVEDMEEVTSAFVTAKKAVVDFMGAATKGREWMRELDSNTPFLTRMWKGKSPFDWEPPSVVGDALSAVEDWRKKSRETREAREAEKERKRIEEMKKDISEFMKTLEARAASKVDTFEVALGKLNMRFRAGGVSVLEYTEAVNKLELGKLNTDLKEGKIDIDKYTSSVIDLEMAGLSTQFSEGKISVEDFTESLNALKIQDLEIKFRQGAMSLKDYNKEMKELTAFASKYPAFKEGVNRYIESVGELAAGITNAIADAFKGLEDYFVEFMTTGKDNFRKFTDAVLADIARIIVRAAIVRPLAEGISSIIPAASPGTAAAPGGVGAGSGPGATLLPFSGKMMPGTTTFDPFGDSYNNAAAKMGGSDAQVNITVINNASNTEIQQQERSGPNGERMIELVVMNKVKEGIASGAFDKVMGQSYGLNRRGS